MKITKSAKVIGDSKVGSTKFVGGLWIYKNLLQPYRSIWSRGPDQNHIGKLTLVYSRSNLYHSKDIELNLNISSFGGDHKLLMDFLETAALDNYFNICSSSHNYEWFSLLDSKTRKDLGDFVKAREVYIRECKMTPDEE